MTEIIAVLASIVNLMEVQSETNRPFKVHIMGHTFNLIQGLLEKSKLVHHAHYEGHKLIRK
jgi:hypothetical protein